MVVSAASVRLPVGTRCSGNWCLVRIIEPTSKRDSLRVLEEVGVGAASYPTLNRRCRSMPRSLGAGASFMAAHGLRDVAVVADAGMISDANQAAIEDVPDGHAFTQLWPASQVGEDRGRWDKAICYQYRADRARRTLLGIDEQVAKAENAVAGKAAVRAAPPTSTTSRLTS
ncbi:hypothetical protein GCM10010530_19910 [Kribbella aluminosa]